MAVAQAGVDTWSVAWYVRDQSPAARAMEQLATEATARGAMLPEPIGGHRVGWFPGTRMVWAEGHPGGDRLGRADDLPAVLDGLEVRLHDYGIPVTDRRSADRWMGDGSFYKRPGRAGVRRLDLTCDLTFDSEREGLAVLGGVAALPLPRVKTQTIREAGGRRIETVYFRGAAGRKVLGRWYDKGLEALSAPRGTLIRPEDQRRYPKAARPPVEACTGRMVRETFRQRFYPLWRASKGIKVGDLNALAAKLAQLQRAGRIEPGQAKAVAGHLLLDSAQAHLQSARQVRRDRALARRHGLVLADGVLEEVEIDLEAVLEQALEADGWGSEG